MTAVHKTSNTQARGIQDDSSQELADRSGVGCCGRPTLAVAGKQSASWVWLSPAERDYRQICGCRRPEG